MFCPNCGSAVDDNANNCSNCGASLKAETQATAQTQTTTNTGSNEPKSKLVAGLLGIFLGGWGIHNFYLGFTSKAIIQIVVTIVTCGLGALWGLIEGILILCGNINKDANGVTLKD